MVPRMRALRLASSVLLAVLLGTLSTANAGKCPNVQIVVERSSSMGNILDIFSKLVAVQGGFRIGLGTLNHRYGLTAFPRTAAACDTDNAVLPADGNAAKVTMTLDGYAASGSASTGTAIAGVAALPAFADASRPQFMILVTDGAPSCSGSSTDTLSGTVNELRKAYMQTPSIATLVIGVGALTTTDADALNQMATAGGRPLPSTAKYYATTNSLDLFAQILAALSAIDAEVGACSETSTDMGGSTDMSGPVDMAGPIDMRGVDMSGPRDLSTPDDLSMSQDLSTSRDLSSPAVDLRDDDQGGTTVPAPVVDWIDPNKLTFGAGGTAEVVGRHFVAASPSSQVFLASGSSLMALSNALVLDAFHIQVSIPGDLPVGSYEVVVKNPDGQLGRQPGALTIEGKARGCDCSVGHGHNEMPASLPPTLLLALALVTILRARRRHS